MGTAANAAEAPPPEVERLSRLYERHRTALLAYCLRRLDPSDADDAVADVFAVACRRIDEVPNGDAALPWLYGVAYRVVARQWRNSTRTKRMLSRLRRAEPVEKVVPTPETQIVRNQEERMIIAALSELSETDQEILRLIVWEELPHADAATVVGSSEQTVRQRYHRAKKRLHKQFARLETSKQVPVPNPEGGQA